MRPGTMAARFSRRCRFQKVPRRPPRRRRPRRNSPCPEGRYPEYPVAAASRSFSFRRPHARGIRGLVFAAVQKRVARRGLAVRNCGNSSGLSHVCNALEIFQ